MHALPVEPVRRLELAGLSAGNPITGVYALRALAVIAVAATAVLTVRLAPPPNRAAALVLVAANPLVIVHLVGGVHVDAGLAALGAVVILAVRQRWWVLAVVAAATAFAIKLPGLVLIGYVLVARLRRPGFTHRRLAATARLAAIAAGVALAYATLVPNGWGWVTALHVPGIVRHPYDPTVILSWLLHRLPAVRVDSAVSAARTLAAVVAVAWVAALLWRAGAGSGAGRRVAAGGGGAVGVALIVVALAAPTVHPWYLTWGMALVAIGASSTPGASGHRWVIGLSVALCFSTLPEQLVHSPVGLALIGGLLITGLVVALRRDSSVRRVRQAVA